jgi:hypothetical protein
VVYAGGGGGATGPSVTTLAIGGPGTPGISGGNGRLITPNILATNGVVNTGGGGGGGAPSPGGASSSGGSGIVILK